MLWGGLVCERRPSAFLRWMVDEGEKNGEATLSQRGLAPPFRADVGKTHVDFSESNDKETRYDAGHPAAARRGWASRARRAASLLATRRVAARAGPAEQPEVVSKGEIGGVEGCLAVRLGNPLLGLLYFLGDPGGAPGENGERLLHRRPQALTVGVRAGGDRHLLLWVDLHGTPGIDLSRRLSVRLRLVLHRHDPVH